VADEEEPDERPHTPIMELEKRAECQRLAISGRQDNQAKVDRWTAGA
jgi:hypothetical protein